MSGTSVLLGMVVSSLGGALVLWVVIDKLAWWYVVKVGKVKPKPPGPLSIPLGILERVLYVAAFILGMPGWVAVWLGVKAAVQWNRWKGEERVTYNVFLIGNAISILFGFIGACIALGKCPGLSSS